MQAVISSLTTSTASSATGQPLGSRFERSEAEAKSRAAETEGVIAGKARCRVKHMVDPGPFSEMPCGGVWGGARTQGASVQMRVLRTFRFLVDDWLVDDGWSEVADRRWLDDGNGHAACDLRSGQV